MAKGDKVTEKTIRELCKGVVGGWLPLMANDNEAIVIYQDLIGHATVEENRDLANDPALMETFYRIYGIAYGTVAAIKFYLTNSDKIAAMQADIEYNKDKVKRLETQLETERKTSKFWNDKADEYKDMFEESKCGMEETQKVLNDKDRLIMALKAKLYDLTQNG